MAVVLLIAFIAVACVAVYLATRTTRLGGELVRAREERERAVAERGEMAAEIERNGEARQELAAASARLEAVEAERDRLLGEEEDQLAQTHKHVGDLRRDLAEIKTDKLPEILGHTSKAASGAERVEHRMTGWMRTIANPQARGAFGELAVENQLRNLGLELGRDYFRQVPGDDGRKRADYVVRAGDGSVIIDAKFVLDEEIESFEDAVESENADRLVDFGRRLRARAEDLSKRDYSRVAGKDAAVVLLYVPVEGAYEALKALPNFSAEKFARKHRVYVVTPAQLGLALGLIAEVTHKMRYEEEVGEVANALVDVAEQMAEMIDGLDLHGKHLATAFKSYDNLVGMTGTRSKLWRRAGVVWDFARRRPKLDGEVRQISPPRDDADEIAERWRAAANE